MDDVLQPNFGFSIEIYFGANRFSGADAVAVRSVQRAFWYVCRSPQHAMSHDKQQPQQLTSLTHSVGGVLARHRIDDYAFPFSDMVLYLLDEPVTNIEPIAFNRQASLPLPGTSVKAIGYGLTSSGGSAPSVLLEVNLEAVAESVCDEFFAGIQPSASELICVYTNGKGICQGDSGGPVVTTVDGELTLLGVTSFGGANACGASPSGFIATSHHQTSFIDNVSFVPSD
jgi:Trypsin